MAAQTDRQAFALLVTTIDWSAHSATDLTRAIDLALALDMVSLARELAHHGSKIFPEDKRLHRPWRFWPPCGPRDASSSRCTLRLLRAGSEYASHYTGQYIAVRGGTLLGSASTLQELHERIGVEGQTASTIVVKAYPEHPGPFSSHSYPLS